MTPAIKKTSVEIESMRQGGRILAETLAYLEGQLKPGVSTAEISELAAKFLASKEAEPAFLGYNGFPAPVCVSANEQVVHGIPGGYVIKHGDIVGLDLGVKYRGLITDGAITVPVGPISVPADKLLKTTKLALENAISKVRAGAPVGDISAVIGKTITSAGLSVVHDLSGHGVGRAVHEEPEIPNHGEAGTGPLLEAGMTIAIEPMACIGQGKIKMLPDGWTIATADGSLAAQFEHTVLVTDTGAEVLTAA